MPLIDFCQQEVVTVTPETDVQEAACLMREQHVGDLVVCAKNGRRPIGMITDRDIVSLVVAKGIEPRSISVEDVMMRRPVVAREDEGIMKAIRKMQESGVRRLPIVDANENLCGIVTVDDLLGLLAHELTSLAEISGQQIENEQTGRALSSARFA